MNLPDLIRRSDRAVSLTAGRATPTTEQWRDVSRNVVLMEPGTTLLLQRANEFECLKNLPHDITWRVWMQAAEPRPGAHADDTFILEAVNAQPPSQSSVLFRTKLAAGEARPVLLDWPTWMTCREGFDLRLRNNGSAPVALDSGPSFNSRRQILPLMKGTGIEIGPGLNPHILPSQDVDVRYVEHASAEEWVRNYKKTDKPSIAEQQNLWSNYIVADAQLLSTIPDGSLDFIYSNHVFEHLMNPLGVLENWRRKLSPVGIVAGVVPDCRYTFDLRQPPSTAEEWVREYAEGTWAVGAAQYERWCKFTAPYNTPENLIERNYSVHVHFYTSETFADLERIVVRWGLFQIALFDSSPNHKDFGFVLRAA